ncbi:CHAD domain-containing protein [Marinimicrobium sp. C2-29]|uniref:CHAD domain-containing protein n=1 Tax=Marinimicrobium sp. C2-29 TaxID=3139825 RepID=UPI003138E541
MSYAVGKDETVQKSLRRIGREQIDKAIAEIDDPQLDRHEAIHQVRKRCKKLRALVRLVRPALGKAYRRENARFRDIARNLAVVRDEQSMVEALERLLATLEDTERATCAPVLVELRKRRDTAAAEQDPEALLSEARQALEKAHRSVDRWCLEENGFKAVRGFGKTYKRGRKAARRAFTGIAGDFHGWRKRVKYHSHHLQLLRPLWPRVNKAWRNEGKALADILGNDHDLALLDSLLESEGERLATDETRQRLQQVILEEQQCLRGKAWEIGQRLYAEKPKALGKRWQRYWQIWERPAEQR